MSKRIIDEIPSVDVWNRKEFCDARKIQLEQEEEPIKLGGKEFEQIILKPDYDEIICDYCNAEVNSEDIRLVNFGRAVACEDCFKRVFATEPRSYRPLYEDGSLGPVRRA